MGQPSPSEGGELVFLGGVGTGWSAAVAGRLVQRLPPLQQPTNPFTTALPREYTRHAQWVRPELIIDVDYRTTTVHRTTGEVRLRHPSFRGLRPDLTPEQLRS
jgi:bifunctional non-homologous end joining protein LigD